MFNRPGMKADLPLLKQQPPLCRFCNVSSLVPRVTLFEVLSGMWLLERYIGCLDDAFLVLTQLVEKVYGACCSFDPGEGMSRQTLDGLCAVMPSPAGARKDGCGFMLRGWTLECSLLHALTGNVGNAVYLWRPMKQLTYLLGYLLFQPELSKAWWDISGRALKSSEWLFIHESYRAVFM